MCESFMQYFLCSDTAIIVFAIQHAIDGSFCYKLRFDKQVLKKINFISTACNQTSNKD